MPIIWGVESTLSSYFLTLLTSVMLKTLELILSHGLLPDSDCFCFFLQKLYLCQTLRQNTEEQPFCSLYSCGCNCYYRQMSTTFNFPQKYCSEHVKDLKHCILIPYSNLFFSCAMHVPTYAPTKPETWDFFFHAKHTVILLSLFPMSWFGSSLSRTWTI